jgi:hypothetical protein
MVMYIKADDPDLPAFFFDQLIHPIPAYASGAAEAESGDGALALSDSALAWSDLQLHRWIC